MELLAFTLPLFIIMIINNALLERWTVKTTTPVVVLALSTYVLIEGFVKTSEASAVLNLEAKSYVM